MDIADRRVLVVGGSGVLGGLIAEELARRGAVVALAGREADRLAASAARFASPPQWLAADLLDRDAPRRVVEWAVEALGGLDGIVNAAGVVAFSPLADTDPAALAEVIAVNLTAPLTLAAEAIPHMTDGFIVNLSGVVAERTVTGLVAYVAAKAGLSAACRSLAEELRRDGAQLLIVDARPPHTETG
ncbi:MAG: SDR family oxidoreductase, partial [Actinobacteria bacterium]|nr:SDR family oxidoreductase [Actinomycetota bacterium]